MIVTAPDEREIILTELAEPKISNRRLVYVVAIYLLFLFGTLFLALQNQILIDEILCALLFDIVILGVLFISLIRKRVTNRLSYAGMSYRRLFVYLLIGWAVTVSGLYLPQFLTPFALEVFILASHLDDILTMGIVLYFNFMFCLLGGASMYVMCCYYLVILVNSFLAQYLKEKNTVFFLFAYICVFAANLFLPIAFSYFTYTTVKRELATYIAVYAVLVTLFARFVYPALVRMDHKAYQTAYEILLDDEYPLIVDLQRFSMAEYVHARRVSELSADCAAEIGANELACACGGLYYRMGKMLGEPEIKRAVIMATNHCFPPEVILILGEFEGKERLPQSPESAIVQMVDALITRLELIDKGMMESSWNQDMLIYQTLNEFSNDGMYDEAGLSMNQFLRIREKLVQEGIKL